MKPIFTLVLLCVLFSHKLAAQNILSLRPLFTEQSAIQLPGFDGTWKPTDFDVNITIEKTGDNFYSFRYGEGNDSTRFEAVLVKIGHEYWMDLEPVTTSLVKDDEVGAALITGHRIYRINCQQDTLLIQELSYNWVYDQIKKNFLSSGYEWVDNRLLFTMPTMQLFEFIRSHINDSGMTRPFVTMIRQQKSKVPLNRPSLIPFQKNHPLPCQPAFPHRDGWFGGDGDVSVQLNDTLVLWLFSDSWVGTPEQTRQSGGWQMVSNSVAVASCYPNKEYDIHFFWRDMYTSSPQPVFNSFTNRYRYWVNDAFFTNNALYVLLEKIGQRAGAAPDELFNFSAKGFTLAKVLNPFSKPSEWVIDYIPMPDFYNPHMGMRTHAMQGGFLYFFVSRNDMAQLLVRKKISELDDPTTPFEYFAINKTWKKGIQPMDMDTLYQGFRGTTISYHPEIKKWIMFSDITFMSNQVHIRTAPELTGPWSTEKLIYEIPETTPGNAAYDPDNFCYLPRECSLLFKAKKGELWFTYDINNRNFDKMRNNSLIYTPKVIILSGVKY